MDTAGQLNSSVFTAEREAEEYLATARAALARSAPAAPSTLDSTGVLAAIAGVARDSEDLDAMLSSLQAGLDG